MPAPPPSPPRLLTRDGKATALRIGLRKSYWADLYHFLITTSWAGLIGLLVGFFVLSNLLFALGYLAGSPCIENARPGSFEDLFFFSVQTMGTIGYGKMSPVTFWSHLLMMIEVLVGYLWLAMATGLIFAKFSRPTARVLFSQVGVVGPRDGVPTLMFRLANERGNQIVEAQVRVVLARIETTTEGETLRRFHDLPLARERNAIFALSWTLMHPITPSSLLHGVTPETFAAWDAQFVISVIGLDETISQTVHARTSYVASDILWNHRFVDLFSQLADGRGAMDFRNFHKTEPLAPALRQPLEAAVAGAGDV
ncbi:MAG: ATP-sensitive inward rectifier potassium channel 10 [Myxococcales bacterium]|nr:ATP-sensitive inward rectifier potassium channel 10 [Myxococcales bacterium]